MPQYMHATQHTLSMKTCRQERRGGVRYGCKMYHITWDTRHKFQLFCIFSSSGHSQSAVHQSISPSVSQSVSFSVRWAIKCIMKWIRMAIPHTPLGLTFFFGQMLLTVVANPGQIHWLRPSLCRLLTKLFTFCLYAGRNFCLFSVTPPLSLSPSLSATFLLPSSNQE